jgi:hypothetical protein
LCPDRQHPDEQRQRRQRGSFLDHGPYHDSFLQLDRTRTMFYFCSRVNQNRRTVLSCLRAKFPGCPNPLGEVS